MSARLFLSALLLLGAASLPADAFSDAGLKVKETTAQNNQTEYHIEDAVMGEYSIISAEVPAPEILSSVVELHNLFASWKLLKMSDMTFMVYPSQLELNVKPASFVYKGMELAKFTTAGLEFFHTNVTTYSFRLLYNNAYPRVAGTLTTEEALAEAIWSTLNAFAPAAAAAPTPSAPTTTGATGNLSTVATTVASAAELEGLRQQNTALQKELADLRDSLEKLRRAVIILNNLGIFGDVKPVDAKAIAAALKLKADDPGLLQEEIGNLLAKQGISITSHEIFLIFSVYLNEYK